MALVAQLEQALDLDEEVEDSPERQFEIDNESKGSESLDHEKAVVAAEEDSFTEITEPIKNPKIIQEDEIKGNNDVQVKGIKSTP